jgi:hypothetical protein
MGLPLTAEIFPAILPAAGLCLNLATHHVKLDSDCGKVGKAVEAAFSFFFRILGPLTSHRRRTSSSQRRSYCSLSVLPAGGPAFRVLCEGRGYLFNRPVK